MKTYSDDVTHEIYMPCHDVYLDGLLHMPAAATGLVIFVHGSGSSRLSTRNQHVANALNKAGLATLLFDLLTAEEEKFDNESRSLRFKIDFLAVRLAAITNWCEHNLRQFHLGYFGASTGAAAAIVAASRHKSIKAIVSRGGRPDLARDELATLATPTLLIIGGEDKEVIIMNQDAKKQMQCVTDLVIIPGATHLFEEYGMLDQIAVLAQNWFKHYLK
jgi:putative phosphoribosyl transferase